MTLNVSFALECLLNGSLHRARELMKDGIELCSMIEKGEHIDDIISYDELQIWEFMKLMKQFFNPEELLEIINEAKEIKSNLDYALNSTYIDCVFSMKEIRKMQHFFNRVGSPFLKLEISKSRR